MPRPAAASRSRCTDLEDRAGAVPQDPRRGRRPHRGHVRAAQPVGHAHRRCASAARWRITACSGSRTRSARWTTLQGLADLRRRTRGADLRQRDAGRRGVASATCWRPTRVDVVMLDLAWCGGLTEGAQDRGAGRGLQQAAGAARLHRPGHADGRACIWRCMRRPRSSRRSCARRWRPGTATSSPSCPS